MTSDWARTGSVLLTGGGVFVFLFVSALAGAIGMGAAKLSFPYATLLAWFGPTALVVAFIASVLTAGVYTVTVMARRRTLQSKIPFGPFMALGVVVGLLAAAP